MSTLFRRWYPVILLTTGCAVGIDPPTPTEQIFLAGSESFQLGNRRVAPCERFNIDVERNTTVMSANDWVESERLVHEVAIDDFCMDRTEVTLKQYRHCFLRGTCPPPATTNAGDSSGVGFVRDYWNDEANYGGHPALGITHEGARAYCAFRGGRLPTEVEWEFAARGRGTAASLVSDPDLIIGIEGDCGDRTGSLALGECSTGVQAVGTSSRDVTVDGLHDLYGNAAEWTADEADKLAYCEASFADGTALEEVVRFNQGREVYVLPSSAQLVDEDGMCLEVSDEDSGPVLAGRCEDEFDVCATQNCFRQVRDEQADADVCLESCFNAYEECSKGCLADGVMTLCARRTNDDAVCRPSPWCRPRVNYRASAPHRIPDSRRNQDIKYIYRGGHFQTRKACEARPTRRQTTHELGLPQLGFRCVYEPGTPSCEAP